MYISVLVFFSKIKCFFAYFFDTLSLLIHYYENNNYVWLDV